MKKTKLVALILSVLMLVLCFTSCGGGSKYGKINGESIDADLTDAMIRNMLMTYSQYVQYYGGDIASILSETNPETGATMADSIKDEVVENLKYYKAIEKLAKDNNIALNDDDKAYLAEQKDAAVQQEGGKAEFVKALEEQGMTEEVYDYVQSIGALSEKVFNALYGVGGINEVNQDAILADVMANNVRVRHIVLVTNESDPEYATKRAKAEEALRRAKAGEDFEALIAEYGEDPGMETYVDGYVFSQAGVLVDDPSSTLDPTFTETSWSLKENEISEIVLSTSGLHIIKRLPLDEAFVGKNMAAYYESYAYSAFSEKLAEISETFTVETTDEFKNLDLTKFLSDSTDSHTHA